MVLQADRFEIAQRRLGGPQRAGERRILGRDREQEDVVDRQQRPQQDRDRHQVEPGVARDPLHCWSPFDRFFIMYQTSGSTSGIAQTIVAIAMSTWSRRI